MAIFKSKTDPNAAYALPPELIEAMATLQGALDTRSRLDETIAKNFSARQAASEACSAAEEAASRLYTDLALEIDDGKITALESAVERARKAAHEAAVAFDRADRLQGALYARAPEADAQIAAAKQTFEAAMSQYSRATVEALTLEARDASQNLVSVLKRGHAVAASIGALSRHNGFLGETRIPSPGPGGQFLVGNDHAETSDGERINLAISAQTDPSAKALADVMRPLSDLRRRAAQHTTFIPPRPAAKPYETSPANRTAALHNAEIDAREGPWKPPAGTFNPQVFRIGDHSQPQKAEVNPAAGVADRAVAELGGAA